MMASVELYLVQRSIRTTERFGVQLRLAARLDLPINFRSGPICIRCIQWIQLVCVFRRFLLQLPAVKALLLYLQVVKE